MQEIETISFGYSEANKVTNIDNILSSLFVYTKIPQCIVSEIGSFLFLDNYEQIRIIYEAKCRDYTKTKDTYYKSVFMNKYDFIFQVLKTIIFKYLIYFEEFVLPFLRRDINYLTLCHLNASDFTVNKEFIHKNRYIVLQLFIELCQDFQHRTTYLCIHSNNERRMNDKYFDIMEKNVEYIEIN